MRTEPIEVLAQNLIANAGYAGVNRSEGLIVIEITLNAGRTLEIKRALYAEIALILNPRMTPAEFPGDAQADDAAADDEKVAVDHLAASALSGCVSAAMAWHTMRTIFASSV